VAPLRWARSAKRSLAAANLFVEECEGSIDMYRVPLACLLECHERYRVPPGAPNQPGSRSVNVEHRIPQASSRDQLVGDLQEKLNYPGETMVQYVNKRIDTVALAFSPIHCSQCIRVLRSTAPLEWACDLHHPAATVCHKRKTCLDPNPLSSGNGLAPAWAKEQKYGWKREGKAKKRSPKNHPGNRGH